MKKVLKFMLIVIFMLFLIFIEKDKIQNVFTQKSITKDINNSNIITNLLLVNNDNKLMDNYKPQKIDIPNIPFIKESTYEEKQMESVAARAVEELFTQARSEGINFLGTSAYRSYDTQKSIYKKRILSDGVKKANQYVAKPGTSEHQTGLCIDVTNEDRWFVESTKEARWLAENAHEFGFIIRYPKGKEDITGKSYEPWHIRYVGKEIATNIYNEKLTLEEYLANK